MKKIFKYSIITKESRLSDSDEIESYGYDKEIEVNENELISAITDIIYKKYFKNHCDDIQYKIIDCISNNDSLNDLIEYYEDELSEYFAKEYEID